MKNDKYQVFKKLQDAAKSTNRLTKDIDAKIESVMIEARLKSKNLRKQDIDAVRNAKKLTTELLYESFGILQEISRTATKKKMTSTDPLLVLMYYVYTYIGQYERSLIKEGLADNEISLKEKKDDAYVTITPKEITIGSYNGSWGHRSNIVTLSYRDFISGKINIKKAQGDWSQYHGLGEGPRGGETDTGTYTKNEVISNLVREFRYLYEKIDIEKK